MGWGGITGQSGRSAELVEQAVRSRRVDKLQQAAAGLLPGDDRSRSIGGYTAHNLFAREIKLFVDAIKLQFAALLLRRHGASGADDCQNYQQESLHPAFHPRSRSHVLRRCGSRAV